MCRGFRILAKAEQYDRLEEKLSAIAAIYIPEDRRIATGCFRLMLENLIEKRDPCAWCNGRGFHGKEVPDPPAEESGEEWKK